jgi:hypothetical protein
VFGKKSYAKATGRVKYGAFLPNLVNKRLELSVFRTSDIEESKIWEIGQLVAAKRDRTLRARADLLARKIIEIEKKLSIVPDTKDHELHANILGWPQKRAKQVSIAQKLADKSAGKPYPERKRQGDTH